jgi:mannose-6-phosphate isomerase-like protein (cupin superfamily)
MRSSARMLAAFLAGILCAIALHSLLPTRTVQAQAAPAQSGRVEQFENDAAHVWRTTVVPHGPLALHHHDHPRIVVALTSGTMDLVDSSGAKEEHVWEAGHAYWLPAMPPGAMHSDVNPGDKPMELMVIEMKHEK